jgi:hypothetical protein
MRISGFGTLSRTTHALILKDAGVFISGCGCFTGTIDDFTKRVKKTSFTKDTKNSLLRIDYLSMIRLMKSRARNVTKFVNSRKRKT